MLATIFEVRSLPEAKASQSRSFAQFAGARDGDLIFRRGRDMISRMVMSQGEDAQFSHVGVVVRRGGRIMVVNAMPAEGDTPGGVIEEPLSSFASEESAARAVLYRMDGLNDSQRQKIDGYVLSQMGKPFDDQFSMKDDGRMYCAELAVKAYRAAGVDLAAQVKPIHLMTIDEGVIIPDRLSRIPSLKEIAEVGDRL